MSVELRSFCFSQPGCYLLPAEHLREHGLSKEFATLLRSARGAVGEAESHALDATLSRYFRRVLELSQRAPEAWMPPRKANLLVITDPTQVRLYTAPFAGTTWTLDASELDATQMDPEYAVYQLVHTERLAFLGSLREAVLFNLSYWLLRTEDEIAGFARAASRAQRRDAAAFLALARALPWIRSLYHLPLRPPVNVPSHLLGYVEGAELLVPQELQSPLRALLDSFETCVEKALQRVPDLRTNDATASLCRWMQSAAPEVLVLDEQQRPCWDPTTPKETQSLYNALGPISSAVAESLQGDFSAIDASSAKAKTLLGSYEKLPRISHEVESDGGVYLRAELQRIVYELRQPGFVPREEVAPPFHRLLLTARVAHEWGHLAHEAGWIAVPSSLQTEHAIAVQALQDAFTAIVSALPERVREETREELRAMGATRTDPKASGALLATATLSRMPDYCANVFARQILSSDAMEAYVRNNLRHHLNEGLGPLSILVRHAMEVQYLAFDGADRRSYFYETSWFAPYFLDSGVFSFDTVNALFDATARVCACYHWIPIGDR